MIQGTGEDFAPNGSTIKRLETQSGLERVSDEEGFEGLEKETDPEDQQEPIKANSPEVESSSNEKPVLSEEEQTIMANFNQAKKDLEPEVLDACKALGITLKDVKTPEQAKSVMTKMDEMLS